VLPDFSPRIILTCRYGSTWSGSTRSCKRGCIFTLPFGARAGFYGRGQRKTAAKHMEIMKGIIPVHKELKELSD
jgi:hypothetical protein